MWIVGAVALVAMLAALGLGRFVDRAKKPAWDSLTHEEQGIAVRNGQRSTHGHHEAIRAQGWGPPSFNHDPSRR